MEAIIQRRNYQYEMLFIFNEKNYFNESFYFSEKLFFICGKMETCDSKPSKKLKSSVTGKLESIPNELTDLAQKMHNGEIDNWLFVSMTNMG